MIGLKICIRGRIVVKNKQLNPMYLFWFIFLFIISSLIYNYIKWGKNYNEIPKHFFYKERFFDYSYRASDEEIEKLLEKYQKIQLGLSENEVFQIMGSPWFNNDKSYKKNKPEYYYYYLLWNLENPINTKNRFIRLYFENSKLAKKESNFDKNDNNNINFKIWKSKNELEKIIKLLNTIKERKTKDEIIELFGIPDYKMRGFGGNWEKWYYFLKKFNDFDTIYDESLVFIFDETYLINLDVNNIYIIDNIDRSIFNIFK